METIEIKKENLSKKGIGLISLIITIIVMIILASVAIFGVTALTNNGKKATFAADLKSVQDAVEMYYSDNSTFPIVGNEIMLSNLKTLSGAGAIELEQEIVENLDTVAGTVFYEVDMNKINSTGGTRGRKAGGLANDIFVVSSKNMIVYYVKGEKIGFETYFSLTSKLTNGTNIKREEIDYGTLGDVVESQGIKITKNKKDWTNSLNITVETILETGETATYTIAGIEPANAVPITTGTIITIPLNASTITGADATNFNGATDENKIIVVQKLKAGVTVAKATMKISNLDLQIGALPIPVVKAYNESNILDFTSKNLFNGVMELGYYAYADGVKTPIAGLSRSVDLVEVLPNTTYTLSRDRMAETSGENLAIRTYDINKVYVQAVINSAGTNSVTFTTANNIYYIGINNDTVDLTTKYQLELGSTATAYEPFIAKGSSSIKEIRYEYVTKYNSLMSIENYYINPPTIDENYMKNSSKKQAGTYISIPKHIKTLVVSMVDKAGNISSFGTITMQDSVLKAEVNKYKTEGILLDRDFVKPTTNIINKEAGTVEAWVEVNSALRLDVAEKTIFSTYTDEKYTNTIVLRHTRDGLWQAIMSSDYANVSDISIADTLVDGKYLFTIRWSSTRFSLFINGVEVAYTTTSNLMSAVPTNFHIGSGPRLNLVKNGYVTTGDNTNFTFATYSSSDYSSPLGSLSKSGFLTSYSTQKIPVDTKKVYTVRGTFKSIGSGGLSALYFGVSCMDEDGMAITSGYSYHYNNTETVLTSDLEHGALYAEVNSISNWKTSVEADSRRYLAIYNYKNYEPYTYTRYTYVYSSVEEYPVGSGNYRVNLAAPYSGNKVLAGTKVANNYASNGFNYNAALNVAVPIQWTTYTGNIWGEATVANNYNFRSGTKYVQMLFLFNYIQDATFSTMFDDIEFIDITNSIFNSKIQDICISNIARSDSDIFNRYKKVVLEKDSNVTYMLTQ